MVYRFLLLSDETNDFRREIKIGSEATFLDLHHAIADAVKYRKDEMCSFFICDDDWSKKNEITLIDMGAPAEVDTYLMEDTPLEELLEDEHQKLLYVFDYMTERAFFMELSEIITGQNLKEAVCSLAVGKPPVQFLSPGELEAGIEKTSIWVKTSMAMRSLMTMNWITPAIPKELMKSRWKLPTTNAIEQQ